MGRQFYLHRMALGRSAYEPEDAKPPPVTESEIARGHYVQQFDSKGNPFNPEISEFNKSMRDAQNEALLLTGVVERKDRIDREEQRQRAESHDRRQSLLAAEHDKGELLDWLMMPMSFFSHIWMEALIKRIQIGAYDPSLSMLSILDDETTAMTRPSLKVSLLLARRFPALGDMLSQFLLRIPLVVGAEQLTGRLQLYVHRKRLSRRVTRRLYTALSIAFEATLILIDLALLPVEFYTTAQALSLIPALPLFPPWNFISPLSPTSFHSFGWKRTSYLLTSPAVLLSISRLLRSETSEEGFPIGGFFTSFRWPEITDDPLLIPRPALRRDPLGWAMYQAWSTRTKIMQCAGWRIVKLNPRIAPEADFENDTLLNEQNQLVPTASFHRSTALAHAPAQFLANAIDAVFRKIALLPFESLMLRSVALAVSSSSLLRTGPPGTNLYTPFGGPLSRIGRSGGLAELGAYTSRLGLGILINASLDVVLFFGVYKVVRKLGVERYEWVGNQRGRQRMEESREEVMFEEVDDGTIVE